MLFLSKFKAINSILILTRNTKWSSTSLYTFRCRQISQIRPVMKGRKYAEKDGVPPGYEIIYRTPMEYYLSAAQTVSTVTVGIIGGLLLYKVCSELNYITPSVEVHYDKLMTDDTDIYYFGAGFALINIALRLVVSKYTLRIYRNLDNYIAVFEGHLPFIRQKVYFKKGEVQEIQARGILPWRDSRYKLKNKHALLLIQYFRKPVDLSDMMRKSA